MKSFIAAFIIFFISGCFIAVKAAEITIGQSEIVLDPYWKFKPDYNNQGQAEKWFSVNFNDSAWDKMQVPGNWDLHNPYANYKGKAWYRTQFLTPKAENKTITLSFGEVGMSYKVYLNDQLIAHVICGNYVEHFDITTLIQPDKNNQLAVEVDNSLSWGAFWNWGGFRRPVKLLISNPIAIERQEISANPDLKNGSALVTTTVFIKNSSSSPQIIKLDQQLYFQEKEIQKVNKSTLLLAANATTAFTFKIKLSTQQVKLWHFDHPHLYKSTATLMHNEQILFRHSDKFGIRKIEIDGYRFKLNGESLRLVGYNWVADDRSTGNTLPEFRFKEDIDLMKAAGANFARLSHRPLPQDVLDYIDEKGILIFSEFNNWPIFMNAKSEEPKLFAKKLIQQSFNHPSIIGWSVGNENGNLKEFPEVNAYTESIIKYIKTNLDSTRLVNYVSHTADFQDNDAAQYGDILMINKYGNYEKAVDELKKRYPNKAVFMSEYGGHTDNLIYDTPDNSTFKSLMVDGLAKKENVFGYALWTFNDYRSNYQVQSPLTTTPLHQNRQWGIVDVYRNKKRAYQQMQHFYAPVKKLQAHCTIASDALKAVISIQPRSVVDIPSFQLNGYALVWEVRQKNNVNRAMGKINLAQIVPGSASISFAVNTAIDSNSAFYKVSLLSPLGYSVLDTTIALLTPQAPKITAFLKAAKEARVVFEKDNFTDEYVLKYRVDGVVQSLKPTLSHFADLTNLSLNKKYKIWLVGINSKGQGKPSDTLEIEAKAGYVSLPPAIWLSEPSDQGFFIGHSMHYSDNYYEVRYGENLSDTSNWKTITSSLFGMLQITGLKNGMNYYYQMSRKTGFNNVENIWTAPIPISPNAQHQYAKVILHGYVQQASTLTLSITPSKNAIGYKITCKTAKGQDVYRVNQSHISMINIPLNHNQTIKSVQVETL